MTKYAVTYKKNDEVKNTITFANNEKEVETQFEGLKIYHIIKL